MSPARKLHEGLGILLKYEDKPSSYVCAEHDEVFLPGPHPDKISEADRKRLEELGIAWHEDVDSWHSFT